MSGDGRVTPSNAVGGGSFVHFLFPGSNPPVGGTPPTIVATGTWKAKRLVSFNLIGTWGVFGAGILEMLIRLVPDGGPVTQAMLKVVCNIGAAGLSTGQEEGFELAIPGTQFAEGGSPGPFKSFVPALGLSVFSTANEKKD